MTQRADPLVLRTQDKLEIIVTSAKSGSPFPSAHEPGTWIFFLPGAGNRRIKITSDELDALKTFDEVHDAARWAARIEHARHDKIVIKECTHA